MKKLQFILIIFLAGCPHLLLAQGDSSDGKALNFPSGRYGISFGNSHNFTGIRINLSDKDVEAIHGLNVTLWLPRSNKNAVVNGISFGLIPNGGKMRPVNLGIIGLGASQSLSGLSVSGFFLGSDKINGVSLSGLYTEGKIINGLACSGLFLSSNRNINGLAICPVAIWSEKDFSGVALTIGYLNTANLKGLSVAGYANTLKTNGVSIALFNRTKELQGIQLGVMNYAGNNPKGLRILPLVNLHLGKNKNSLKQNEPDTRHDDEE